MKLVFIICLLSTQLPSFGQDFPLYDSLCSVQKKNADSDYNKGKYKFCVDQPGSSQFQRIETTLDSLCRKYKLTLFYDTEPENCTGLNPFYCYSNFMDSVLGKKFGKHFKDNLIMQADQIFISKHRNDTISHYYCDDRAEYSKGSKGFDSLFFSTFQLSDNCRSTLTDGGYCSVNFIVNKKGQASHFKVVNDYDYSTKCGKEIKIQLLRTARRFKYWKPARVSKNVITCQANLLVDVYRRTVIIQ